VHAGEIWLDTALVAGLLGELSVRRETSKETPKQDPLAILTDRECELILLIAEGLPNKQIGKKMAISEKTVAYHLTTIFNKLQVSSRLELLVFAYRHGLIRQADK
jgi:DNA-binding NarL/FixJ family response regulator